MREKRKTLWMRFVDFEIIKDLIHIINNNSGKLTASKLEEIGISEKVFIKKETGLPLTHSPRYHYRKILEHLEFVKLIDRKYFISNSYLVNTLIKITSRAKPLNNYSKYLIGEQIINNEDCHNYFLRLFNNNTLKLNTPYSCYNEVFIRKNEKKNEGDWFYKLYNNKNEEVNLKNNDEIQALLWGVRLWLIDLGIINEVLSSFKEDRMMYIVNPLFKPKEVNEILYQECDFHKTDEWTMIYIPELIKKIVLQTRFKLDDIKNYFYALKKKYPSHVMYIKSSTAFINIKTPFEKQDVTIRNIYLYDGEYISHIRFSKTFFNFIKNYG